MSDDAEAKPVVRQVSGGDFETGSLSGIDGLLPPRKKEATPTPPSQGGDAEPRGTRKEDQGG